MFRQPRNRPPLLLTLVFGFLMLDTHSSLDAAPQIPVSPEVHADRTVTLRLKSPNAKTVSVASSNSQIQGEMTKDDDGVWSRTVGPLDPNTYEYHFNVDGTRVLDPVNRNKKAWIVMDDLIEVPPMPGQIGAIHQLREVAHGQLHQLWYASPRLKMTREVFVYTPPQYSDSDATYPVLYLLHGYGDDASAWSQVGRANFVADNILADGDAKPCIIVMPLGHANVPTQMNAPKAAIEVNYQQIEAELLKGVIPMVESKFRCKTSVSDRAIAGLSMGGGQAVRIGLSNTDKFAFVYGYSSAFDWHSCESKLTPIVQDIISAGPRIWIGCGEDDFLRGENESFEKWLSSNSIKSDFVWSKGGHSWPVWRLYLETTLRDVFKPQK